MTTVQDELMHYGVLGMKWGRRSNISKESKDFNKLKSTVSKASKDLDTYFKDQKEHTYSVDGSTTGNVIVINNAKLEKKAIASSAEVDKLVSNLSKKYSNISAVPNKDIETGKMYVDIVLGTKSERLMVD